MLKKYVFTFDEASADDVALLGGKGAGLVRMIKLGLPVPPGFIITTEACQQYFTVGDGFLDALWEQVVAALKQLEVETQRKFGDRIHPLILSVRSGAMVSMPGMLETILNVGINDYVCEGLEKKYDVGFSLASYLRLLRMFGETALGIDTKQFESVDRKTPFRSLLRHISRQESYFADKINRYKEIIEQNSESSFPRVL